MPNERRIANQLIDATKDLSFERRVHAARGSLLLLFGSNWHDPRHTHLESVIETVEQIAGDDAWEQAARELDIDNMPDEGNLEMVMQTREEFRKAFSGLGFDDPMLRYFRDARAIAKGSVTGEGWYA